MRLKLSTVAAAATALLGLAALSAPAMAAKVIYHEQPLALGSNYVEPLGGTNGFPVVAGNTYFIDFTLPAFDKLLTIGTDVAHKIPGIGPIQDFTADTFDLYAGTATACGANICGVGGKITPLQLIATINAKVYNFGPVQTATHFVLEVVPQVKGTLQGNIELGAVPEPATWAMMILGVGMIGLAARRRRDTVAFA